MQSSPHSVFRRTFAILTFLGLSFLLLPEPGAAAQAQTAAASQTQNATTLTPQEAQQLLGVLNDPKQRETFTHNLSLMAKGLNTAPAAAPAPTAASANKAPPPVADTKVLHSDLSTGFSSLKKRTAGYLDNFLALFKDLRTVGVWFHNEVSNPQTRALLIGTFTRAFMIIGVALLTEWGIVFFLRKPLHRVTEKAIRRETLAPAPPPPPPVPENAPAPAAAADASSSAGAKAEIETQETRADDQRRQIETLHFLGRIPYALMHGGLKLCPVLGFLAIAFAGSALAADTTQAETVTETLALAYAAARTLFILLETCLAPRSAPIRLLPVGDSTAMMLTRWWNILVAGPAVVVCLSVVGGEFDLSDRGTAAMIRAVVLVEHLTIAVFIWRLRPIVSHALAPQREASTSAFWSFMIALAHFWWLPALFLDAALWLVWAAQLPGGYEWILRTTLLTIVIVAVARLAAVLAYGAQDRLFRLSPELAEKRPDLQKRADVYYPFVRGAITAIIIFLSFLGLTESWGIDTVHFFFSNQLGSHLLAAATTLVIAVTVAAAIWELINALLNRQIERYSASAQESRATRLKTVLPILRTVLRIVIVVVVTVTSLSQIGINVTPLLTGAGILGAAVAFGSQSLVKDFITGFFMLVEDALQVGDWVTTGGVSGFVEHLSIRTVRVRAINGDLHIIPFSSVTSIANTGRDFNQIIIRQTVDLSENIPRVVKIMSDIADQMRKEDAFRHIMLSGYNDIGVDSTDSNGSVIIGTIKTTAMMKWKVQREFYKRIANPMAAEGVKFYTPTSYTASAPGTALTISAPDLKPAAMAANEDVPEADRKEKNSDDKDEKKSQAPQKDGDSPDHDSH